MATSHYLPVFIQVGLGDKEKTTFPVLPLSYSASLKTTSVVQMSSVFGAPIFTT